MPVVLLLCLRNLIKPRYTHINGGPCVSWSLLLHLFCVGLRLFLHAVCFGARRLDQQSVGKVSHRPMRLEVDLENEFVEALLLDPSAVVEPLAPPSRLGLAGGSVELPSILLLFCDQAAVPPF